MARYLIEEPKNKLVDYSDDAKKSLENIIMELKRIVGTVTLPTAAHEHFLFHNCFEVIQCINSVRQYDLKYIETEKASKICRKLPTSSNKHTIFH